MHGLRRILPYRLAFLVATSLRFVPFFAREIHEIAVAQRLRGANLTARALVNPLCWKDLFFCLLVPILVRAMKTADEAALSAEARGFGTRRTRTFWDPASFPEPRLGVAPGSSEKTLESRTESDIQDVSHERREAIERNES
jgi:energy-coupling factor transporter transmembrane protein EcfT